MKLSRILFAFLLVLATSIPAFAVTDCYYNFAAGTTTPIVYVTFSEDVGDTTANTPLTNKVFSDFEASYCIDGAAPVSITLATLANNAAAYSSGGMIKISDTTAAGRYRLDLPAAVVATANTHATVFISYNDLYLADVHIDVGNANTVLTAATSQPGQGTPSATASMATQINYLYKAWRNRWTVLTNGEYRLYNDDATTIDQKATVTNVTGRGVISKAEVATGP